jgi:hypothetical protein
LCARYERQLEGGSQPKAPQELVAQNSRVFQPWFARHDANAYSVMLDKHGKIGWAETVAMPEFIIGNFLTRSCRLAAGRLTHAQSQAKPGVSCRARGQTDNWNENSAPPF